jgi:hypothetical protein
VLGWCAEALGKNWKRDSFSFQVVATNASAPKANVPEQLGSRFRRKTGQVGGCWHASATWGVWNSLSTSLAGDLGTRSEAVLARLAGPVRWTQSAVNASSRASRLTKPVPRAYGRENLGNITISEALCGTDGDSLYTRDP